MIGGAVEATAEFARTLSISVLLLLEATDREPTEATCYTVFRGYEISVRRSSAIRLYRLCTSRQLLMLPLEGSGHESGERPGIGANVVRLWWFSNPVRRPIAGPATGVVAVAVASPTARRAPAAVVKSSTPPPPSLRPDRTVIVVPSSCSPAQTASTTWQSAELVAHPVPQQPTRRPQLHGVLTAPSS
jgi:hypothetical protein